MDCVVKLNGTDISEKINVSKCFTTDRLGGMCDDLQLEVPYEGNVAFNKYDGIEVIAGDYSTGIMYVDECGCTEGKITARIKALSYKHNNKKKKSRLWSNVTLYQLADDVAKNCGLTVKTYGTVNYTYGTVFQREESDMGFLARVCAREGYSVKCSGQYLIIFNDYYLENNQTPVKLTSDDITSANLKAKTNCLSEFTVSFFDLSKKLVYSYTATDKKVDGGSAKTIEVVTDQSEAERFAKGYLRAVNSFRYAGGLVMGYNPKISAGTVIELTGYDAFDGLYIVYEVTHAITDEKTYLKIRNTLDY